jgi:dienelactone hydrolase
MPEKISFATEDGVTIVGDLYEKKAGGPWAILLHMMPATKESWTGLATALADAGFTALAIDLRGHGESVVSTRGRLDYKLFTEREQQEKERDVEAAARWLADNRGMLPWRLAVVGGSIGANLALRFAAAHHDVPIAVALSPGLDYRGVTTLDAVKDLAAGQRLWLAASDDDEFSYMSVQKLAEVAPEGSAVQLLSGAGHANRMFDALPCLEKAVADWIAAHVH